MRKNIFLAVLISTLFSQIVINEIMISPNNPEIGEIYSEYIELINNNVTSGYHKVSWDAGDHSSGLYFVKLIAGSYQETQKIMLIK